MEEPLSGPPAAPPPTGRPPLNAEQTEISGASWRETLRVKNTFLETRDDTNEAASGRSLGRASSDPTSSRSCSSSSCSQSSAQSRPRLLVAGPDSQHTVWGGRERLSGQGSSSSGAPSLGDAASRFHRVLPSSDSSQTDQERHLPQDAEALSPSAEPAEEGCDTDEPRTGSWSVGSQSHALGTCRPCHFYVSKGGCTSGASCAFCHLAHEARSRPCRVKRARAKRRVKQLMESAAASGANSEEVRAAAERLSERGSYLRTIVIHSMRNITAAGVSGAEESARNIVSL